MYEKTQAPKGPDGKAHPRVFFEGGQKKGKKASLTSKKATLTIDVAFDEDVTDAESIAQAMDKLLETARLTVGMEEYGDPKFGEFLVQ